MEEKDSSVGKPEEEKPGQLEGGEFIPEELEKVLEEHGTWLVSEGKEGTKANLQGADLMGANLQKAVLWKANLQEAKLMGANLQGVNLGKANLQKAILWGAELQQADLTRTNLREAVLQDADLKGVKGLQGGQLAGANVSGAKLPEDVAKFEEGLRVVEEASRNARKLFFAMLSACAYALLTIATTTDVRLLTNSASSPLPIIRTEIPIVWFYIAAPLVLLGLYFYFHLYMQRLWEGLALLPAVFPDGRPLDQKAYPWLLTGLVRAHVLHLRKRRPPLSRFQEWVSVALAWWFLPVTLICFWLRYIPRQDWFGTALHIGLLVVAVWAGVLFYRLAVGTLRWDENELALWKKPFKKIMTYKRGVLAVRLGMIVLLLSLGTINGASAYRTYGEPMFILSNVRTWVPYVFEYLGFSPFADISGRDVSTKPPNWSGKPEEIRGVSFGGRNLRYVQAYRAFLVNADLRGADMDSAILTGANLQGANLKAANLSGAVLFGANLQGAILEFANLQGADIRKAFLQEANLIIANLSGADLSNANLQKADLWGTNLGEADLRAAYFDGADLRAANLRGTLNLTLEQLSKVKTLYKAKLDQKLEEQLKEKYRHFFEEPKPAE